MLINVDNSEIKNKIITNVHKLCYQKMLSTFYSLIKFTTT